MLARHGIVEPMKPPPPPFAALLHAQRGIFTRSQAKAHGITEKALRSQVSAERWRTLGRQVYAAFTGPLHPRHVEWFAVLAAGPGACLSHETAAFHHGLLRERPVAPHVLIPFEQRIVAVNGCVLHRTRSFRTPVHAPPMTSVADTLCDLATSGWRSDRLAAVVALAIQQRLVHEAEVRRAIEDRGRFRGVGLLRELVSDVSGGAHSALELRFLRDVERAHGLPCGTRQARARHGGPLSYRDVHYADYRVTVELDGERHHGSFAMRLRDARRDRLATSVGELPLRYGWLDVRGNPCAVAVELANALTERGWSGALHPCQLCGA